jgi:hypothetical protein
MAGSAVLNVKVLVDAAQAAVGLEKTVNGFSSFAGKAAKLFAGAFAADKIIGGIKKVVDSAADLQQISQATDKVFGDSSRAVHDWAKDTQDSIQLSAASYEKLSVSMAGLLRQTGEPMDQVAQKTHNLMQVSADFAAIFNTTVADSANRVRAALAGEYDSLQNMGVAISGNIVHQEALRLAHGNTALSMTDAIKTQAAYNVILQEGSQYTGAAEADAKSFTGQLEALKAEADNAAGTIGTPLIQALSGVLERLKGLVPFLTTVATGLASVVAWAAQLPAPVQAAAVAFVAFQLALNAGWVTAIVAGWRELIVVLQLSKLAFIEAGAGLRGMTAAAQFATSQMTVLRGVMASIAIAAGVFAITGIISEVNRLGDVTKQAQADLLPLTEVLAKNGKQWNSTADAALETSIKQSAAFKSLVNDGFSAAQAMDILKGTTEGLDRIDLDAMKGMNGLSNASVEAARAFIIQRDGIDPLIERYLALGPAAFDAADGISQEEQEVIDAEKAHQALINKIEGVATSYQLLANETGAAQMLGEEARAMEDAARAADIWRLATDKLTGRSATYADAQFRFGDSMSKLKDEIHALAEEGTIDWDMIANWDVGGISENMPKLGQAIQQVRRDMADWVIEAFKANGGFTDVKAGAAGAKVQMHEYADQVRRMLEESGAAPEKIDAISRSLGVLSDQEIDDLVVKIIAEDHEARKKALFWSSIKFDPVRQQFVTDIPEAVDIANQLNTEGHHAQFMLDPLKMEVEPQTPKPSIPEVVGTVPPVKLPISPEIQFPGGAPGKFGDLLDAGNTGFVSKNMIELPVKVTADTSALDAVPKGVEVPVTAPGLEPIKAQINELNGKTVTVTVSANANSANTIISALTNESGRTATITVAANPAPAQAAISALTGGAYQAMVMVKGDNNDAIRQIRNVTTGVYDTTIAIKGDNNQAISSIRSITTGRYETTVFIGGDNSGAIREIRNITTGFYSTTVHINGDASGFYSVWNSLPTSKTITVTVNQVQGSVVAPPAGPGGLTAAPAVSADVRAFTTAPTLAGGRASKVGKASVAPASSVTNINVEVGVGDPDAIARVLKRVMLGRDRRSGGVVVGEMRARVGHS